jgi:23S rRNA G2445 N2-methylase RlmL
MKAIARTRPGLEEVGIRVLNKGKILNPGVIEFPTTKKELNTLKENPTCFQYIYELILKTNKISEIKKIDFSKIKPPFRTKVRKKKGGDLSSQEIEQEIGKHIYLKYKKEVSLNNPETIVLIEIIDKEIYVGLETNTEKLSKREYRIKTNRNSLPGDIAYAMLKIADFKPTQTLLDPFCETGEIAIEATKIGKKIIATDENPYNIKKAKLNAEIAQAEIDFKNRSIDWLDTELEKNSISKIITNPPKPSKFIKRGTRHHNRELQQPV